MHYIKDQERARRDRKNIFKPIFSLMHQFVLMNTPKTFKSGCGTIILVFSSPTEGTFQHHGYHEQRKHPRQTVTTTYVSKYKGEISGNITLSLSII